MKRNQHFFILYSVLYFIFQGSDSNLDGKQPNGPVLSFSFADILIRIGQLLNKKDIWWKESPGLCCRMNSVIFMLQYN